MDRLPKYLAVPTMNDITRRRFLLTGFAGIAGLSATGGATVLSAQEASFTGERTVEAESIAGDRKGVWTMSLVFRNPRIISADIPGRGTKSVWYMWYQVYNLGKVGPNPVNPKETEVSGDPHVFVPEFELVTLDRRTSHLDEVLPTVLDRTIRPEVDPNKRLTIHNSISIGRYPIPVTDPRTSLPKKSTGVAIWSDVAERAGDTNSFAIFIAGLSDGWVPNATNPNLIQRKTLQLTFQRLGDGRRNDPGEISFKSSRWVYRSASLEGAAIVPEPMPKKPDAPKE